MSPNDEEQFKNMRSERLSFADRASAPLDSDAEDLDQDDFDLADLDLDLDMAGLDVNDSTNQDRALLREALGNYKAETLRFAERQSAAMPTPRVNKVVALWDSTPRWALAATTVLALGFSTIFVTHRDTSPTPVALAAAPTAQALAEDNRLLSSVDQAISDSNAPTEADLGLTATPAHSTKLARATN